MKLMFCILFSTVFFWSSPVEAQIFRISNIKISCGNEKCLSVTEKVQALLGTQTTLKSLKDKLRLFTLDSSIGRLSYRVFRVQTGIEIEIDYLQRQIISDVKFESNQKIDFEGIRKFLPFKDGQYYNRHDKGKVTELINKFLLDRGLGRNKISIFEYPEDKNISLKIVVNVGKVVKVTKIQIYSSNSSLTNTELRGISKFKNKAWQSLQFKVFVDQLAKNLFNQGYFFSKVNFSTEVANLETGDLELIVNVVFGEKFHFYFRGLKRFDRQELLEIVHQKYKNNLGTVSNDDIAKGINDAYEELGMYGSKVSIEARVGKNKREVTYKNYFVNIEEGQKIPLNEIPYSGNIFFNLQQLEELYYEKASTLAARSYLDKKYLAEFSKILKQEYLKRGFVFSKVPQPQVIIAPDFKSAKAVFLIKERQQTILKSINFQNISSELVEKIKPQLINKIGKPLNVVKIQDDLNKVLRLVREEGFYFARITNLSDKNIIQYSSNYNSADINLVFKPGKKALFDNLYVLGNAKTKGFVVEREVRIKKRGTITPKKLEDSRDRLSELGLFSRIKIIPKIKSETADNYLIDIFVRVKEKRFGLLELAPGYRTDLGAKLSVSVAWNNLWRRNHSASVKAQTNYRFQLSNLDARRKGEGNKFLEGLFRTSYRYPYFLLQDLEFGMTAEFRRKRFFGFDADIYEFSPKLSYEVSDRLSFGLKYQFETIRQFDATEEKDEGRFEIGGITPSVAYDRRNNPINPSKGFFLGVSWEFANPTFFAQDDKVAKFNFYRLISRNKFYYPIKNHTVLALSLSFGQEKNFSRELAIADDGSIIQNTDGGNRTIGFIPSIKVFRLDGVDVVRGFADSEINRLESGVDISSVRIQNTAYFANIKFEPRYYIDDTKVISLFLDAGRVYVDKFQPTSLRSAFGTSLKFLTPVGTLNFDYGIKTHREKLNTGGQESFGRFHLSIGYF
ncbi:MAG: BamA/TamA family outer membrane protein [Halobacteriovoraceae bacterium]|nr:BamA/TamA family outer membrane protein [Halobacteriovoraceae bacterium]